MGDEYWTKDSATAAAFKRRAESKDIRIFLPENKQIVARHRTEKDQLFAAAKDALAQLADPDPEYGVKIDGMVLTAETDRQGTKYFRLGPVIRIRQDNRGNDCEREKITFAAHVLADLQQIRSLPSGRCLLTSLESYGAAHGCKLWIDFVHNLCPPFTSQTSIQRPVEMQFEGMGEIAIEPHVRARPSTNIGVAISYNPLQFGIPMSVSKPLKEDYTKDPAYKDWGAPSQKPPDVTLFHEMVHADDYFRGVFCERGIQRGKETGLVKIADLRAVGLDRFADRKTYSENSYRAEREVKTRAYYKSPKELANPTSYYGDENGLHKRLVNEIHQRTRAGTLLQAAGLVQAAGLTVEYVDELLRRKGGQ